MFDDIINVKERQFTYLRSYKAKSANIGDICIIDNKPWVYTGSDWSLLIDDLNVTEERLVLSTCECCGAPLKNNICEYCGSTYRRIKC